MQPLFYLSLFVGLLFIGTRIDSDDWFLLTCGRYVESFGVPHVEPFTIHEGWHYVMQQWLFALGLWKLYSAFGLLGLTLYAYAGGAIVLLLYDRLVHLVAGGGDTRVAEICLVLPLGCLVAMMFFYPRPQVTSMIVFLCEIYLLERYRQVRPRWLFLLFPAMSALLINLHAALWPMFLILLLPYLAEALFGGRLSRWLPHDAAWTAKEVACLLVLSAAAGVLNPYGVEDLSYTALSYSCPELRLAIVEVKSLGLDADLGLALGSLFFFIYFLLTALYARHPQPLRYLLLAAGTGFLGLLSIRSLFLFLMLGTFPVARILAGRQFPHPSWTARRKALVAMLALANIALFFGKVLPVFYEVPPVPPQLAAAVTEMERIASAEGNVPQDLRLYTDGDVGSYAEFHGFRIYLDTRAEIYTKALNHKKDVFHEHLAVRYGRVDYSEVLPPYRFDAFLIRRDDVLWSRLACDPAYVCIWDSASAGVGGDSNYDMRIYREK